jgi:hypothetical protein
MFRLAGDVLRVLADLLPGLMTHHDVQGEVFAIVGRVFVTDAIHPAKELFTSVPRPTALRFKLMWRSQRKKWASASSPCKPRGNRIKTRRPKHRVTHVLLKLIASYLSVVTQFDVQIFKQGDG